MRPPKFRITYFSIVFLLNLLPIYNRLDLHGQIYMVDLQNIKQFSWQNKEAIRFAFVEKFVDKNIGD